MDEDMWSALPCDLLVDISRRLGTTAVIRCAGACRNWRRSIIDNARCLRPRPDQFFPGLLLCLLQPHLDGRLQYVPVSNTAVPLFTPPATGVSIDGRLYKIPLSSRDGFLLLAEPKSLEGKGRENLCLCTVLTGTCRVLPAAAFDNHSTRCIYVLATGYDVDDHSTSGDGDETPVWIIAVEWQRDTEDATTYQIFSSRTGAWGPVKRSARLPVNIFHVYYPCGAMVCHGAISWLVHRSPGHDVLHEGPRTCVFSMDLSTERTWTTEIPATGSLVLAVSEDGQLSLVKMLPDLNQMEVWVLVGDDGQWKLRGTVDVQKLFPNCPILRLSGFCQRSGYLFGTGKDDHGLQHHFLIGVDGSSPRLIGRFEFGSSALRFPYQMDCSAYISKMKYF